MKSEFNLLKKGDLFRSAIYVRQVAYYAEDNHSIFMQASSVKQSYEFEYSLQFLVVGYGFRILRIVFFYSHNFSRCMLDTDKS